MYIIVVHVYNMYCYLQDDLETDPLLEKRRADLIHTAASVLDKGNLIKYDKKTGAFQVSYYQLGLFLNLTTWHSSSSDNRASD